jgi:hypothetical protein
MADIEQMSRQMGISKGKASSLMKKAKKMNGYNKGGSSVRKPTQTRRRKIVGNALKMARNKVGEIQNLTPDEKREFWKTYSENAGKSDIQAIRANLGTDDRSRRAKGFASGGMARIQGTPPAQVKGFTYNDNGGKGTF